MTQQSEINQLNESIVTVSEKVTIMSESVAILVSQKKDRDNTLKELKKDLKEHLAKADKIHDKMDKTAKDYTDIKTKNLRVSIDFRTKMVSTALSIIVTIFAVAGGYIISDLKEEIALNRSDVKDNKFALSNQVK